MNYGYGSSGSGGCDNSHGFGFGQIVRVIKEIHPYYNMVGVINEIEINEQNQKVAWLEFGIDTPSLVPALIEDIEEA